jgi:16S rRNA (cytidine1402-2'-O)-methyltransferase
MLYIIPTPIGNLEDITLRAIRVLGEVDGILAEDTRVTAKLLKHLDIQCPITSHHKNNEHSTLDRVIHRLNSGETLAMVSDAGTPGISDPGFLLVRRCVEEDIPVETLPGPTAFVPALVNSGLPCERFHFEGFLPHKKGRQTAIHD